MKIKTLAAFATAASLQSTVLFAASIPPCEPPAALILGYGQLFCQKPTDIRMEDAHVRIYVLEEGFSTPFRIDRELRAELERSIKETR